MDVVNYTLASKPEITVEILKEYATIANNLFNDFKNNDSFSFDRYPFLNKDPKSLRAAIIAIDQHYAPSYENTIEKKNYSQDLVYLNFSIYGANKEHLSKMKKNLESVLDSIKNNHLIFTED